MVAGKRIPTSRDRQKTVSDCTVVDLMASRRSERGDDLTWRSYAEGYPDDRQCHLVPSIGGYARKHVPLLSFETIQDDPGKCENVRAAQYLGADERAGRLPSYVFFTPDLVDDAHDGSLDESAAWLAGFVRDLVGSPAWTTRTLLIVTFDESDGRSSNDDNHIYTVLLGDMIRPGPIAGRHDHYGILRLIEGNFGLCPLGAGDGAAEPIVELWPAP
jgi:acid phosphatase